MDPCIHTNNRDVTAFSGSTALPVYAPGEKVGLSKDFTLEPVLKRLSFHCVNERQNPNKSVAFDAKSCAVQDWGRCFKGMGSHLALRRVSHPPDSGHHGQ